MNKQLLDDWIRRAKERPVTMAFPEATEENILKAARQALDAGAINAVLVGDPAKIEAAADTFGVSLSGFRILASTDEAEVTRVAESYASRFLTLSAATVRRKSKDPMNYALALEALGEIDAVFAGYTHTTGDVILGAQMMFGLKEGISTVSSMGIMDIPGYEGENGSLLAFADSAVCVSPSSQELADIAISTCETVRILLGWEPKCALLSFSTDGSSEHEYVDKIREAVKIANEARPDLAIDGEFQLDAAIVPAVAAKKLGRESPVAGHANVIVWPDINAGNIGVKLVQQFARCDAYGPILQGFALPVADCSRGAPVTELLGNIVSFAVRARDWK